MPIIFILMFVCFREINALHWKHYKITYTNGDMVLLLIRWPHRLTANVDPGQEIYMDSAYVSVAKRMGKLNLNICSQVWPTKNNPERANTEAVPERYNAGYCLVLWGRCVCMFKLSKQCHSNKQAADGSVTHNQGSFCGCFNLVPIIFCIIVEDV